MRNSSQTEIFNETAKIIIDSMIHIERRGNMKKRVIALLLALVVVIGFMPQGSAEAAGTRTKKAAYKAYYDWIKSSESKVSDYNTHRYNKYKLIDLDNDKIPELVGLYQDRNQTYIDNYIICSFDGVKVNTVKLTAGVAGVGGFRGGASYVPKKGKVFQTTFHSVGSYEYHHVYKIKKGEIKETYDVNYNMDFRSNKRIYKCNGKKISKSKFNSLVKKKCSSSKSKDFGKLKYISKKKMLKKLK